MNLRHIIELWFQVWFQFEMHKNFADWISIFDRCPFYHGLISSLSFARVPSMFAHFRQNYKTIWRLVLYEDNWWQTPSVDCRWNFMVGLTMTRWRSVALRPYLIEVSVLNASVIWLKCHHWCQSIDNFMAATFFLFFVCCAYSQSLRVCVCGLWQMKRKLAGSLPMAGRVHKSPC